MSERMLITKVIRTNQTQAELYGQHHKFVDLRLFDLSELATVGVKVDDLVIGQETPARFWAIYELSDKLNKAGNPYKDVIALEQVAQPATTTSTDTTAMLDELRAIRALLQDIALGLPTSSPAAGQGPKVAPVGAPAPVDPPAISAPAVQKADPKTGEIPGPIARTYGNGREVDQAKPAELQAFDAYLAAEGHKPPSREFLRNWVANTGEARK